MKRTEQGLTAGMGALIETWSSVRTTALSVAGGQWGVEWAVAVGSDTNGVALDQYTAWQTEGMSKPEIRLGGRGRRTRELIECEEGRKQGIRGALGSTNNWSVYLLSSYRTLDPGWEHWFHTGRFQNCSLVQGYG